MGLFQFNKKNELDSYIGFILGEKIKELHIKDMAIEHAIDLISKLIAKSEIKIYRYDKKNKKIEESIDDLYYRLNIRVNPNEDGTSFFYRIISQLLREQEVLLINSKALKEKVDYLYLVTEFKESKDIMRPKIFSEITLEDIKGNQLKLDKTFNADEVIHLTLGDSKIKEVIDSYYKEFAKLLKVANQHYKSSNIKKWKFQIPGKQPTMKDFNTGKEISYGEYKEKILEGLFGDEEIAIMLSENFDLELLGDGREKTSEDYLRLTKKIYDDIAMAFNIPLDIFYGTSTEKSNGLNDLITLAVMPIIEIIEDGFNGKLIPKNNYLKGERIVIDKLKIKHYDVLEIANGIDKLMANGFKLNEVFKIVGMPEDDDDPFADVRRFTKNYATSDEILKGGD